MRLIDADELEEFGSKIEDAEMGYTAGYVDGVITVLEAIDAAPTIDAMPVVRGKWTLWGRRGIYGVMYECSSCHAKYDGITRFCPNCGADMRGEHDGD